MTIDLRREEIAIQVAEDVKAMQDVLLARDADDVRAICALTAWLVNLGRIPEISSHVVSSMNGALRLIDGYRRGK